MKTSRRQLLCWLAASPLTGALAPVSAQVQGARDRSVAPSPDGIGKIYMEREIAGVMGWQGAAWLEREEREQEERGDLLLRELRLRPGMNVADDGAGTGLRRRRPSADFPEGPQARTQARRFGAPARWQVRIRR